MSRVCGVVLCVACVACVVGCSVDGSYLERDLFSCNVSGDCGDGWGCVFGSPYAGDFCAPDCDDGCDGVCVTQGDQKQCLRGCRVRDDGSTSPCASEAYSCIRASAEDDAGVCYPVTSCNAPEDCARGEACLSDLANAFGVSGALRTDNLYCVPAPEDPAECPARSIHTDVVFRGVTADLCVPLCDAMDTRCPPGFGCLRQLAGRDEVICLPGIYGVPCDDDTNCLLGTCIDTGPSGKFCTLTCDEADTVALGCERVSAAISVLGLRYHLECDTGANGGVGGGLCSPRYEVGFPCTTPESSVFTCADGLDCLEVPGADGPVKVCTRTCLMDADCGSGELDQRDYCNMFFGVCLPKQPDGDGCIRAEQCQSNACSGGFCQ